MREVLISIQPKWCELIASGKKTVEVRKTKPKLETPFKCYIYCTADRRKHIADTFVPQTPLFVKNGMAKSSIGREDGLPWKLGNGKVIGEFVCDKIYNILPHYDLPNFCNSYECDWLLENDNACLSFDEIDNYLKGKNGYGWHISNLVIYDEPRELSEFYTLKKCNSCESGYESTACIYDEDCKVPVQITRPPQSWCYIETRQTAD